MSYFIKKSHLKKGTYLQIYESYYDPQRKCGAHRSYRALGYVHELMEQGIDDPFGYYAQEVRELNEAKSREKDKKITEQTPEKYIGYFPLKAIHDTLGVKKYLDIMQLSTGFQFNVDTILSSLIYARVVNPCSKIKTYEEVIPKLAQGNEYSLSQLYSALEYIGEEYEKIIEIYNHQINQLYPFDTSHTYFDCTNFYFEIDREDEFRKKGPSKENRKEPLVGMGLLLDANQIPLGMKLYPGNMSEKPILRTIIDDLKSRSNITGRTIQIADKGLNCAENIYHAIVAGDGYIFSKSVKTLPDTEKEWILLQNDYKEVSDKDGNLMYRYKECIDDFTYTIHDPDARTIKIPQKRVVTFNPSLAKKQLYEIDREVEKASNLCLSQAKRAEFGDKAKYVTFQCANKEGNVTVSLNYEAIENAKRLAGYNILVSSELKMSATQIYEAYHNLWKIEESFRVIKSQLDARPVYLQKRETITGHFLVCYLSVLLTRLFQIKVLKNTYSSEQIFSMFQDLRVVRISDKRYVNITKKTTFLSDLAQLTDLHLTSYFISENDLNGFLSFRFHS